MDWLAAKARSESISIGDSVMLLETDRIILASIWDPKWIVKNRYGKVLELVNQESNKEIRINIENVRLVNPHCNWDSVNVRRRRNQLNQLKCSGVAGTLNESGQNKDLFNVKIPHSVTGKVQVHFRKRLIQLRKRDRCSTDSDSLDELQPRKEPNSRVSSGGYSDTDTDTYDIYIYIDSVFSSADDEPLINLKNRVL